MKTAIDILAELLHARPIPSGRVSSSRYRSYWGAVRYEIRLGVTAGRPTTRSVPPTARLFPKKATRAAAGECVPSGAGPERCLVRSGLSGLYARAYGALTEEEIPLVEATERRINALQAERKRRGAKEMPCCSVRLWRHGIELEAKITRAHSGLAGESSPLAGGPPVRATDTGRVSDEHSARSNGKLKV
jgi:hypothetical protein